MCGGHLPHLACVQVNADRDSALDSLSAPGTLLVLCSLVDNMPYVVAEAAVCPPGCIMSKPDLARPSVLVAHLSAMQASGPKPGSSVCRSLLARSFVTHVKASKYRGKPWRMRLKVSMILISLSLAWM